MRRKDDSLQKSQKNKKKNWVNLEKNSKHKIHVFALVKIKYICVLYVKYVLFMDIEHKTQICVLFLFEINVSWCFKKIFCHTKSLLRKYFEFLNWYILHFVLKMNFGCILPNSGCSHTQLKFKWKFFDTFSLWRTRNHLKLENSLLC